MDQKYFIRHCNRCYALPDRLRNSQKNATSSVTEALALGTTHAGIAVNTIAPGCILTDVPKDRASAGVLDKQAIANRTPVVRWGAPEEVAKAALYLASHGASFVTGTPLVVDGGLSTRGDAGEDLEKAPE